VNVPVSMLAPGVFGVSRGGGLPGKLVRMATQSEVGHAFLYLGGGVLIQGQPPAAALAPADSHPDAIWAHRMWDQLQARDGWTAGQAGAAQLAVAARGHALKGTLYDWPAYAAFAAEVLELRNAGDLSAFFEHDPSRVCSGLVADALRAGEVPLGFVPSDGPGLVAHPDQHFVLPPNLVTPGMLLGLGLRQDWF
jgi:hypothetical protein